MIRKKPQQDKGTGSFQNTRQIAVLDGMIRVLLIEKANLEQRPSKEGMEESHVG